MIYIHIPFCKSFCTYCDFYSEIATECSKAEMAALYKEIRMRADEISDQVNTLYIGGGTPSVLPLSVYEELLEVLKEVGHAGPFEEFTIEVNPEDIVEKGADYVKGLLKLGVNRISMGVQSFDDSILKFMNRRHGADTARKAYAILEEAGVQNISIDLIFGLPQLTDKVWEATLKSALTISPSGRNPQHISSYQLSVEPGSALAKMVEKGLWSEASEEHCRRQYDILCRTLAEAGYDHYEISNFALPGHEARHNSAYWRHVPYTGFGPGAHSFLVGETHGSACRRWNAPDLKRYIEDPLSVQDGEALTDEQLVIERIMLALRTSEGISEDFLREHCEAHDISHALAAGDLVRTGASALRIPESRFFVSDAIIASLI